MWGDPGTSVLFVINVQQCSIRGPLKIGKPGLVVPPLGLLAGTTSTRPQVESKLISAVPRVGCGGSCDVWRCLGQVQHSTGSTYSTRSFLPLHLPSPNAPPPFTSLDQRSCINIFVPLVMDTPQTSSANDIFSLSDQTLAERLQFIEEVRTASSHGNPKASLTYPPFFFTV